MTSAPAAPRLDAALRLVPLLAAYFVLATIFAWQASRHESPTIFNDELQLTQLSRSLAESGELERRGKPASLESLYAAVLAPAWLVDDTGDAYALARLLGALLMTSVVFPAYGLARLVLARGWALAAAAAAGAAPALAYAPRMMEEPLAYPAATLALYAATRALLTPTLRSVSAAVLAAVLAALVREQLVLVLLVLALAAAVLAWQGDRLVAWRRTWSRGDWAGAALLLVGAVVTASAAIGHRSTTWYVATGFAKQKVLELGLWPLGSLAFGTALVPLAAGVALALAGHRRSLPRDVRAFAAVLAASLGAFWFYGALKAAYLSEVFGTYVLERNVVYLAPLLAVALGVVLSRAIVPLWALALGGALTVAVVVVTPFFLDNYPYGDAPGLAVPAFANRELGWDAARIELVLVLAALAGAALLLALAPLRRAAPAAARGLGAVLAVLTVAWSLGAEAYASHGYELFSKRLHRGIAQPVDWLDRETGGEPALYLGQQIDDALSVQLLEFWNRSLRHVWSTDGTAPGPGFVLTPDLRRTDGTLFPDPGVRWVVQDRGVQVAGTPVGPPRGTMQLVRLDGPLRLTHGQTGVYVDGWMAGEAAYSQYVLPTDDRGYAVARIGRRGWCSPRDVPGRVRVRIGTLVVGEDKQPAIGRVLDERRFTIRACQEVPVLFPAPPPPYRIEVEISPTFVPNELDPGVSERRALGAQVSFGFIPLDAR